MRDKNYVDYKGVPGADVTWDGTVLRFVIPECPPHNKSITNNLREELESKWIGYMRYAYYKTDYTIQFNKAMCFIVMYLPHHQPWDTDNRAVSYIINGIRYLRLIKDDDSKHLAYAVIGERSMEKPRTEIYLTEYINIKIKLCEFGFNLIP